MLTRSQAKKLVPKSAKNIQPKVTYTSNKMTKFQKEKKLSLCLPTYKNKDMVAIKEEPLPTPVSEDEIMTVPTFTNGKKVVIKIEPPPTPVITYTPVWGYTQAYEEIEWPTSPPYSPQPHSPIVWSLYS